MLAGQETAELVRGNLNKIGNVMNVEMNACRDFDKLYWGIEAEVQPDKSVRIQPSSIFALFPHSTKIKYVYRCLVTSLEIVDMINLKDGDPILFGRGPGGSEIDLPLPRLCNLHLAIARVLRTSGAADLISMIQADADDSEISSVFLQPEDFSRILAAKLLTSR